MTENSKGSAESAVGGRALIGFDIGGSKTHGIRVEADGTVREAYAGSANVSSVGATEAGRALDVVLGELGREQVAAVVAGAAGADTSEGERRLAELVAARVPQARLRVVHDSALILAAAGLDEGVVVIAGTGSVAWGARRDGKQVRAGGWGYLLGDEGSGYGLVRDAVRHVLADVDAGLAPSALANFLVTECGLSDSAALLDAFYARPERSYWAERAPGVCALAADGDQASQRLVAAAAAALVELVVRVARRLDLPGPVVLGGGFMVHQAALQDQVRTRLSASGIVDVTVLGADPVRGAIRLARQLLSSAMTSSDRRPVHTTHPQLKGDRG